MSKIVAIITEYNPFHNGHKYQIDKIREEIPNAIIIAIMSGNVVQRGDFAFADKYARAEMAIKSGIDAVFELPFPYSCSTAEIFASAGVELASKLGAEYLYFGIENNSLEALEAIANAINSEEFEKQIKAISNKESLSYPVLREKALSKMGIKISKLSNDMLAIEYIRAIKNKKLSLEYKAIKRVGAGYKDTLVCEIMSASAIRDNYYKNNTLLSIPKEAREVLENEINEGRINNKNATNNFILANALLSSPKEIEKCFDAPKGMGYYILDCAKKCKNASAFTDELSSKNYTTARLKRALIYSLFKIENINKSVDFTVLLGANEKGKQIIKQARKNEGITVITKHADSKKLGEASKEIYEKGLKADELFATLCIKSYSPDIAYKKTPYIN